ncbi:hypothetical protein KAH55_10075, partial [bacterium]|nr:hypothetical protein [bacterium]
GPGVVATFLGGSMKTGANTCWFSPKQEQEIRDMNLASDGDTVWLDRINATYTAAIERWQGLVQIGMTDLGGNLDILSTFRPGEKLLLDLLDYPDDVERVTWQAHKQWWFYFQKMNRILQPVNPGYSCWTPMYSEIPYYMLQCDFSYMISPDMFEEFVKPELVASSQKLGNAFYHMDGPGQLPHLDSLLQIGELKGIQWVPGAGQPDYDHWADVYRKILDAGKLFQIWGNWDVYERLVSKLGTARGICFITGADYSKKAEAMTFLKKWRVI